MAAYFIGIDIGTQGIRVTLLNEQGQVLANATEALALSTRSREEQSPEQWWKIVFKLLEIVLHAPQVNDNIRRQIHALGVDSTSGTVIPLDDSDQPLHAALMYSDPRSVTEGQLCRRLAEEYHSGGYTGFNTSSGLSKILWYIRHYPEQARKIKTWIHAADYVTGRLCGNFTTTDYTNALKSGYDVATYQWPEYLFTHTPLQSSWFQKVVPTGTPIGTLLPSLARKLGLPEIAVITGLTDGCASQIAAGAVTPGSWNSTIGTTLVIKGVTLHEVNDPQGRIYSHRHPDGYWMPGGASNTGADWIPAGFGERLEEWEQQAASLIPSGLIAWPLQQNGERFPFISRDARGFAPEGITKAQLFTANMEGVAYIERLAYDLIEGLSQEKAEAVFTAGGGSNSDTWLRIRASVLNRPVHKCAEISGAVGAAVAAASKTYYSSIAEAAQNMTHVTKTILPEAWLLNPYEDGYQHFLEELNKRNYLSL